MSEETIAVVISTVTLLVSLAAGFAWMIARSDKLAADLGHEIKGVRRDLGDEITSVKKDLGDEIKSLGSRITNVERELVEVKIAVARIEGPGRHLVAAR